MSTLHRSEYLTSLQAVHTHSSNVRALLDDVERLIPASDDVLAKERLVEELGRLAWSILETAASIADELYAAPSNTPHQ